MATLLAGRYRVGAVIGRGGMGDVHEATDETLDRPVAMKLMRAGLADGAGLRRRFEREARAAARVSHPNVVAIFDVGEYDHVPFIVMERLSGRTLADELAAGPLSESRLRTVAREMLDALAAAHALGVIHRDIKPGNLLVRDDGHVAIADFGIATIADDASHTTAGLLFGTAQYLAPERLIGAPATPASDLYSAGVVLFEALTGRPAFRAETPLALAQAVASETPAYTATERSQLDTRLLAVVDRALAKDPEDRFASAAAMRDALDGAVARHVAPTLPVRTAHPPRPAPPTERLPVEARVVDAAPDTPRRRRRWRSALVLLVVAAAATVAVLAATDPDFSGSSDPPATSPPTTPAGTAIPAPLQQAIDRLDAAVGR